MVKHSIYRTIVDIDQSNNAGDLGVQRGVLRWFLSLHDKDFRVGISPQKLPKDPEEEQKTASKTEAEQTQTSKDTLPIIGETNGESSQSQSRPPITPTPDASIHLPVPIDVSTEDTPANPETKSVNAVEATPSILGLPFMPQPFTPSINKTLAGHGSPKALPESLTIATLKSRLNGKKLKCVNLTMSCYDTFFQCLYLAEELCCHRKRWKS